MEKTLGIIRHTLTFLGGFLVTEGHISDSMLETGTGAIITIVGIVWSVIQKNKKKEVFE